MIDLFFVNRRENMMQSDVIHLGVSGHSLIYVVRKYSLAHSRKKHKTCSEF
jgi:hypothetical protein